MLEQGALWFLLADGRRAKVLIEPRRGAALAEHAELTLTIGAEDLITPQDRPARAFDRAGAGRHAMDGGDNLHEAEEQRFLARVAARIDEAAQRGDFSHLAIAAPPRALGLLRALLAPTTLARVRAETAKDLLNELPPRLRERLHEMLRG